MTNPAGTGIAGQEGLTDGGSQFNEIAFMIEVALGGIATMKLVKVEAVTPGEDGLSGTVDVLPLVNIMDGLGKTTKLATLFGIPVLRIQGGKNAIVIDPVVGDIGIMVIADRDISAAVAAKGQANPGSFRRFNMADGIYIGGICNAKPEQLLTFKTDGGWKLLDKFGNIIEAGDDGITITDRSNNVFQMRNTGMKAIPTEGMPFTVDGDLAIRGTILQAGGGTYAGNFETTGDVIASGKSLTSHTHSQANDGHGDLEQDTSAPL